MIGSYESTNHVDAVAFLDNNYIAIGDRDGNITFLDVSDVQDIYPLKTVNTGTSYAWRFEVVETTHLYSSHVYSDYNFSVINLADTSIVFQNSSQIEINDLWSIEADDSYLFCPSYFGVEIYDISNPSIPSYVNLIEDTNTMPYSISPSGSTLFYLNNMGVKALDIGDISNPINIGSLDLNDGSSIKVDMLGDTAFVWDYEWDKIHIVDLTTPASPEDIGFINLSFEQRTDNNPFVTKRTSMGNYLYYIVIFHFL